ncbi:MAG: mechanosensitive ion channel family protein [Negativicutes bacterium]
MLDLAFSWPEIEGNLLIPALILGASLLMGFVLNYLLRRYITRHTDLAPDSALGVLLHAVRGLPRLWCFAIGVYWTIHTVGLVEPVQRLLAYILFTILVFSITRVIVRTLERIIALRTAEARSAAAATSLLTNLVAITIYAAGAIIILGYYGISIAPLITALGVGGMAVALGLQESLANLFAGLHLILSKQVRVGDYIRLDSDNEGRVTDITWRYTTILTSANNTVVVPNAKLSSAILTNYDMPEPQIAVIIPVGVSYDSDLEKVETVTVAVAADVMERLEGSMVKTPAVFFHTFGDSSIDFNVVLYARRFTDRTQLKHEFIKALTQRYREEGIDIPFPVRTILRPESSDTSS